MELSRRKRDYNPWRRCVVVFKKSFFYRSEEESRFSITQRDGDKMELKNLADCSI